MTPQDRFWEAIYYTDGCWLWKGHTDKRNRYGTLKVNGRTVKAHRFAWELENGPIPAGLVVRHRCDNTLCVNPHHLELGTQLDNVRDSINRGRFHRARGERSGKATLTDAQALEIRSRHRRRRVTYAMLAAEYGVSYSTIQNICRGVGRFKATEPVAGLATADPIAPAILGDHAESRPSLLGPDGT